MSSERQLLETQSPWWGEHLHRYEAVLPYIGPTADVLDIACGTGFGTHRLALHTLGKVVGGDISADTIAGCRLNWPNLPNLSFEVLDGTCLPYPGATFDVLVSFETIEHTTRYNQMLAEFRRVLKAGGKAIISTPNFIINSPSGKVLNPYHTQEFEYDELLQVLQAAFGHKVRIFGQEYVRYKGKKGVWRQIGRFCEWLLYRRGVRKIPLKWQDALMNALIGKPQYPLTNDYALTEKIDDILLCKTFFAICG